MTSAHGGAPAANAEQQDTDRPQRGLPLPLLRWRGFTLQIFLFTILPLTLLLLVIVIGSQSLHHDSMRALVGDRDLRAVRSAANSLTHEIGHRGTILQLLALRVGQASDPTALLAVPPLPEFDGGLVLVNSAGQRIAGSIPQVSDFSTHLPAQNGSALVYSAPVQGQDFTWYILAVTPSTKGNWLMGAFTPAALARSALSGVAAPQTSILLVSAQGLPLYQYNGMADMSGMNEKPVTLRPGVAEVLRGESGVNYTGPAGSSPLMLPGLDSMSAEHVVAFSPVEPLGWGLVLEEPWEETASPLLNATQAAPLILVPVLLLAIFALWFGARQIVQPLQSLEMRAEELAAGDFTAIRQPVGGINEIQNLQDELIEMAGALQSAQEALHSYIGALTAGVETERRSLARELHDDTLQALIALNQQTQMAMIRAQNPEMRTSLLDFQARVGQTITSLRRAIGGLRPIYLEDLGLSAALGMLAKNREALPADTGGPTLTYNLRGEERRLPPETELAFYRIAQEALNNALHHAQAQHVQLTLEFSADSATLTIQDDGQGFNIPTDPGAFAHHGHYGLLGMHERADLAGGTVRIESTPGQGTRVTARWMVAPSAVY